jgi:HK97 family phage major capsid protein
MLNAEQLLQKAVLNISGPGGDVGAADFGGTGQAPLSYEQVTQFIELMSAEQVMLGDVRTVTSGAAKWQESIISFGARIAKPGVEATRLAASDRSKPVTGIVEISTVLLRAEVPVSDETFEDNVAGQNLVQSIERIMADRFGFDIEDLFVNGDTASTDPYLALADGWLVQAKNGKPGEGGTLSHPVDGTSYGQDYQEMFKTALVEMPKRYLRNRQAFRYYVPVTLEQKYRDLLASRNTNLGDALLAGNAPLSYQGIPITPAPSFDAGIVSNESDILLTARDNLYSGYHRAMKFETWRDPREGATSFIITARVDPEIAVTDATVLVYNVDVTV